MAMFSRVDETVRMLSTLGIHKSDVDVVRKILRVLPSDYDVQHRSILHRAGISRTKWSRSGQALFVGSRVAVEGVVGVGDVVAVYYGRSCRVFLVECFMEVWSPVRCWCSSTPLLPFVHFFSVCVAHVEA